ncbi:hypothetical protein RCL_jg26867.t1 [Rhizophagus clarus]|uniref:Uncharacterized protein n=1 Tax=Rhizophagus clarus TaxID=94130 RepID=A0A8H3QQD9_9GLOM|nr:hypothetical protein RCL_jg26867.t1 [Rhizophagus clarus]
MPIAVKPFIAKLLTFISSRATPIQNFIVGKNFRQRRGNISNDRKHEKFWENLKKVSIVENFDYITHIATPLPKSQMKFV